MTVLLYFDQVDAVWWT